jgi:hypothetical protein
VFALLVSSKIMPANRRACPMSSSARRVIRLAIRSQYSGGTAHSGSNSSHGDTDPNNTSRVAIRAALATLLSTWRGAPDNCRRLVLIRSISLR